MTTEPYVPSTDEVRLAYIDRKDFEAQLNRSWADEGAARAEFARFVAKIKADAWAEGYRQGIEDERTANEVQMGVGPNRNNPYRWQEEAS